MTEAEVIALINAQITTNGVNAITANVLAPVLIAMVQQINGVVGDPNELPAETTVIEAINSIAPTGVQVHTGADDPNTTPPASYEVGDFYHQVVATVTVAMWQFVETEWNNVYTPPA